MSDRKRKPTVHPLIELGAWAMAGVTTLPSTSMFEEDREAVARHVTDTIDLLDPGAISALVAACETHTRTNCWWARYEAARLLLERAGERLARDDVTS